MLSFSEFSQINGYPTVGALIKAVGLNYSTAYRWFNDDKLRVSKLTPLMMALPQSRPTSSEIGVAARELRAKQESLAMATSDEQAFALNEECGILKRRLRLLKGRL